MANKKEDISFEVVEHIAELGQRNTWWMELNVIKWNGGEAKLDIRAWNECREKCGKGVSLTEDEGKKLMYALMQYFGVS